MAYPFPCYSSMQSCQNGLCCMPVVPRHFCIETHLKKDLTISAIQASYGCRGNWAAVTPLTPHCLIYTLGFTTHPKLDQCWERGPTVWEPLLYVTMGSSTLGEERENIFTPPCKLLNCQWVSLYLYLSLSLAGASPGCSEAKKGIQSKVTHTECHLSHLYSFISF